jgi:hypothetical protein
MLTEANLLRCVTPDIDSSCYNSCVIIIPDTQLTGDEAAGAEAAAGAGSAPPGTPLRQLHSSAASSTASSSAQLRGVNAALFGLQGCEEEDARGMPAVVIGTLTRAQAAAIKFGESCCCFLLLPAPAFSITVWYVHHA